MLDTLDLLQAPLLAPSLFDDERYAICTPRVDIGFCSLREGDAQTELTAIESGSVDLMVTSPPYNIEKEYEKRVSLEDYIAAQEAILAECHRVLATDGSICL